VEFAIRDNYKQGLSPTPPAKNGDSGLETRLSSMGSHVPFCMYDTRGKLDLFHCDLRIGSVQRHAGCHSFHVAIQVEPMMSACGGDDKESTKRATNRTPIGESRSMRVLRS